MELTTQERLQIMRCLEQRIDRAIKGIDSAWYLEIDVELSVIIAREMKLHYLPSMYKTMIVFFFDLTALLISKYGEGWYSVQKSPIELKLIVKQVITKLETKQTVEYDKNLL